MKRIVLLRKSEMKSLASHWCVFLGIVISSVAFSAEAQLFAEKFEADDSILVVQKGGTVVYEWQADKPLIPASLTKLVTSFLALEKWGANYHFPTDFYRSGDVLWVKGYGDPFIVSEEMDEIVSQLQAQGLAWVKRIMIDGSYFKSQQVPGRTDVADPYNAPLSAVAANFNTAKLKNTRGQITSAEAQSPLTRSALSAAKRLGQPSLNASERINLIDAKNSELNFAELLAIKADLEYVEVGRGLMPESTVHFHRYQNSHTVSDVVRGTLEFSNNFMANQLFLMLPGIAQVDFSDTSAAIEPLLRQEFGWSSVTVVEGSGLSRKNRLSARQLTDLLDRLSDHKGLFKQYNSGEPSTLVRAKTGTLNGVHSFAGYINFKGKEYRFVFNFNRVVPYKYRETLLRKLVARLHLLTG